MEHVYWVTRATINPGKFDDLVKVKDRMTTAMQEREPGALNFELSVSADKRLLDLYERYSDSAAVWAHFDAVGTMIPELMACMTVYNFTLYGAVSDDLKAFAKDFKFANMSEDYSASIMEELGGFTR